MTDQDKFVALSSEQVQEFFHDEFVRDQTRHFRMLVDDFRQLSDLGGGVGHFARSVSETYGRPVQVIDLDKESLARAKAAGLKTIHADVIRTRAADSSDIASFNLVLHHLVSSSNSGTEKLQGNALSNQRAGQFSQRRLFVNEYIYESYLFDEFASRMIFTITSSQLLSAGAKLVGRFVPSLRANTLGVGVRFHSLSGWVRLFENAGWKVERHIEGQPEIISVPRRLAFALKSCRRDSFILSPQAATTI